MSATPQVAKLRQLPEQRAEIQYLRAKRPRQLPHSSPVVLPSVPAATRQYFVLVRETSGAQQYGVVPGDPRLSRPHYPAQIPARVYLNREFPLFEF